MCFHTHFTGKKTEVPRSNGNLLTHARDRIESFGMHDSKILAFLLHRNVPSSVLRSLFCFSHVHFLTDLIQPTAFNTIQVDESHIYSLAPELPP